jgi:hypothetical protein
MISLVHLGDIGKYPVIRDGDMYTLSRQEFSIQGPRKQREIPPIFRPDRFFIWTISFNYLEDIPSYLRSGGSEFESEVS